MNGEIVLTVKAGECFGKQFTFHDHTLCTIGRSVSCYLQLTSPVVSRRHCLLDIDPPTVRIRDLGSRNGTYVNGEPITGPSGENSQPETEAIADLELHEGDMFRVGTTVFEINVVPQESADAEHPFEEVAVA
jgi:pSer/pThr/pTyr-binding forkhead associated (FHA) protein